MIKAAAIAIICVLVPAAASAPALAESNPLVDNEIAALLAAEAACAMSYDQSAVQRYIETHVDEDDADFASTIALLTVGNKAQFDGMTDTAKMAYCVQERRVAKKFGFIR